MAFVHGLQSKGTHGTNQAVYDTLQVLEAGAVE